MLPKTYQQQPASSTNVSVKSGYLPAETETRSMFITLYKYQFKVDLRPYNIRPEALKLVQKRAGNTLKTISIGNDFLSRTQIAQKLKESLDKCDYMKLKSSVQQKKLSLN
jgi:hypothetical protein